MYLCGGVRGGTGGMLPPVINDARLAVRPLRSISMNEQRTESEIWVDLEETRYVLDYLLDDPERYKDKIERYQKRMSELEEEGSALGSPDFQPRLWHNVRYNCRWMHTGVPCGQDYCACKRPPTQAVRDFWAVNGTTRQYYA